MYHNILSFNINIISINEPSKFQNMVSKKKFNAWEKLSRCIKYADASNTEYYVKIICRIAIQRYTKISYILCWYLPN